MAVEAKKIKDRLKKLFPKANLSTKRIDEISARLAKKPADDADDDAIDQVINDANDFMSFEDIAKNDDRIRNLEAKAKKVTESKNETQDEEDNEDNVDEVPTGDEVPKWAKVLITSNKKLQEKLQTLETENTQKSKTQQAESLMSKSKVLPENLQKKWVTRIDLESDIPFEDQIKDLETEFTDLSSAIVKEKVPLGGNFPTGYESKEATDAEVDSVVDNIM